MDLWLQIGLSVLTGVVTGGGALLGVRWTVRGNDRATEQRELATQREEWWQRFTWASELALSDSVRSRVTGLDLLTALAELDTAETRDLVLMDVFHQSVLESFGPPEPRREHPRR